MDKINLHENRVKADEAEEALWINTASAGFLWVEHASYVALGILIALAGLLALGASALALWHAVVDWTAEQGILHVIDRLLFALMLVEILHTVRASMRTGGLTCEPFLVVGLIASIRRVLVITLQSSETTNTGGFTEAGEKLFKASMVELAVLAVLIMVMVIAIFILHRARALKPVD